MVVSFFKTRIWRTSLLKVLGDNADSSQILS